MERKRTATKVTSTSEIIEVNVTAQDIVDLVKSKFEVPAGADVKVCLKEECQMCYSTPTDPISVGKAVGDGDGVILIVVMSRNDRKEEEF